MEFIDLSSAKLNRDYASSMLLKSDFYRQVKGNFDFKVYVIDSIFVMYRNERWLMSLKLPKDLMICSDPECGTWILGKVISRKQMKVNWFRISL